MGNNDKHFWGSREHSKSFLDQGNLSLKHFRDHVVLLMENKGWNQKRLRDHESWMGSLISVAKSIECVRSCDQNPYLHNLTKRMNLHKNRVQSPKEYFSPPRWPPFLCLLLQHGRRDVIWTHSITAASSYGTQQGSSLIGSKTHFKHLKVQLIYTELNPLTAAGALRALTYFPLSNARQVYSSVGNPLAVKGLMGID